MHHRPPSRPSPAARAAVRGLAALWALGLSSFVAAGLVWWFVIGVDAFADLPRGMLAAVAAVVLPAPGVLVLHFERSLRRAALMLAELADRNAAGERFDGPPGLFFRSIRLAMRQRGIGMLAQPWYWAAAAWGFGASVVLIIGACVLVVAALV